MFRSIQKRILVYIVCLTLISLVFISAFNYFWAQKIIIAKDEQRMSVLAESTANKISHYLKTRGQLAWAISQNEAIHSFAKTKHYRDEDLSNNEEYRQLHLTFANIASYYPDISTFYIAIPQHSRLYGNIEIKPTDYPPDYEFKNRSFFQAAVKKGGLAFTLPYDDIFTDNRVISVAVPFYDKQGGLLGIAAVDINESVLTEMLSDINYVENGYAFILNEDNVFVAHPNEQYYLKSIKVLRDSDIARIADKVHQQTGLERIRVEGENKYLCTYPIEGTGWVLGIVVPVRQVTDPINVLGKTSFAAGLAAMLLLAYLIISLMSKITDPINHLSTVIGKIEEGDYTVKAKVDRRDEFGKLGQSLNHTLDKQQLFIRETIDASYKIGIVGNNLEMLIDASKAAISIFPSELCAPPPRNQDNRQGLLELENDLDSILDKIAILAFNNQLVIDALSDHNWPEAFKHAHKNYELTNQIHFYLSENTPHLKAFFKNIEDDARTLSSIRSQLGNIKTIQSDYLNRAQATSAELLTLSQELLERASRFKISTPPPEL